MSKRAEVKEVFRSSKIGNVYGVVVTDGPITRDHVLTAITRNGKHMTGGRTVPIQSLRQYKDEVVSVEQGEECGINLGDFAGVQHGDVLLFLTPEEYEARLIFGPAGESVASAAEAAQRIIATHVARVARIQTITIRQTEDGGV